jgi:crotonobetainyl-CoA:carnitine CoA-transferase CaiB-like acyl-CoA transferase
MRPGVLARLGLDYAHLSEGHPELVMVSLSMLGQTGPLSGIRGYAVVMSGLAGLDSVIGYDSDHLIGTFNPALGDPNGAAHALVALLAALHRARKTGQGSWIDVSQVEAILSVLRVPVIRTQRSGDLVPPGNSHSRWWPHGLFATHGDDTWIAVAVRSDEERTTLADILGVQAPYDRSALEDALSHKASVTDADEMCGLLQGAGLSASTVNTYGRLRQTSDVFTTIDHPWLGPQPLAGLPWMRDGSRFRPTRSSPELGSATTETLKRLLGMGDAEVASLRDAGAIGGQ